VRSQTKNQCYLILCWLRSFMGLLSYNRLLFNSVLDNTPKKVQYNFMINHPLQRKRLLLYFTLLFTFLNHPLQRKGLLLNEVLFKNISHTLSLSHLSEYIWNHLILFSGILFKTYTFKTYAWTYLSSLKSIYEKLSCNFLWKHNFTKSIGFMR